MLSLQRTGYPAPAATNSNTPLFLTSEFQGMAKLLADTNSLPMLSGFLTGVVGTNSAMAGYPYVSILRHNLRLDRNDVEKLTNCKHGHYNRTWMTEVLYRALLQITQEYSVSGPQLKQLAHCCASKIHKLHSKSPVYNFSSPASLACVQELSSYLQRVGINRHLGIDVITENSLKVLDDLSRYFALKMRQEFCLLLTFYGASYDKLPHACLSAELVRRILHVNGKAVQTPVRNLSAQESTARQLVSEAITTHLERTKKRLEHAEVIVNRRHPWYMLHRKLVQCFYAVFTLPKLREDYIALKRLDAVYKDSIMYGDCARFFESLRSIKLLNVDRYKNRPALVVALRTAQSSYKVASHTAYMAAVRSCASQPQPTPLHRLTSTGPKRDGVLAFAHQKVRTKISTASRWLKQQARTAWHTSRQDVGRHYPTIEAANTYGQLPQSRVHAHNSAKDDGVIAVSRSCPSNDNFRPRVSALLAHLLKLLSRKRQCRTSSLVALNSCYTNGVEHMLARTPKTSANRKVRRPVGTYTSRYLRENQKTHTLLGAGGPRNLYAACTNRVPGHDGAPTSTNHAHKHKFRAVLPVCSSTRRYSPRHIGNLEHRFGDDRRFAVSNPEGKCGLYQGGDARKTDNVSAPTVATKLSQTGCSHKKCGAGNTSKRCMLPLKPETAASINTLSSNDNCVSESDTASSVQWRHGKAKRGVVRALKKRLLRAALCVTRAGEAELSGSDTHSKAHEYLSHYVARKSRACEGSDLSLHSSRPSLPPTANKVGTCATLCCMRGATSEYESTDSSCSLTSLDDEHASPRNFDR
ncbi:hypothetical protein ACIS_00059 [Anaplasma centrale str. Israel]|uniref:Uncharacterized protein n=1 Tax=Anaplasma centrale (strain Israel) TaxID=574556 RepID=D1AT91_ANACI|nr:hypothetical protein [Anaplasma centrale]ACZ48769.1 hypothetical protein ACIS_00059 [Anaplasma centrale str. Israel]